MELLAAFLRKAIRLVEHNVVSHLEHLDQEVDYPPLGRLVLMVLLVAVGKRALLVGQNELVVVLSCTKGSEGRWLSTLM